MLFQYQCVLWKLIQEFLSIILSHHDHTEAEHKWGIIKWIVVILLPGFRFTEAVEVEKLNLLTVDFAAQTQTQVSKFLIETMMIWIIMKMFDMSYYNVPVVMVTAEFDTPFT